MTQQLDFRYYVLFSADDGTAVQVLLDAASPVITGGYANWEVVDRPKRPGLTRFKGRDPIRQDIAVLFDGVDDEDPQDVYIQTLEAMAQMPGAMQPPPTVKLEGTIFYPDSMIWVIESITWDNQNVMWSYSGEDPYRLRQAGVVHLLEYVDDDVIVTAPSPAIAHKQAPPTTKVQVQKGMTLRQVAQDVYGDPDKYTIILTANPWLNPDPRAIIPDGTFLSIPGKLGYTVGAKNNDSAKDQQKSSSSSGKSANQQSLDDLLTPHYPRPD